MAGNNVSVKMGVEGISQFKNNINTAKQSLKTLDEQLALNEKQFKATGDQEAYMQQKTELLKVKLEEQKSVLKNAEDALKKMTADGVDKASKAFQDMQRQVLRAKGDLLDTEGQLNGVAEAGEAAGDGVSEMNNQLKRIGEGVSYENVTSALGKITDGMESVIRKAVSVGKAIVKEVLGAGSWADDLHTRAQYFGLTDEDLQRMDKTATLIDTSVESIISSEKKFKKGLGSRDTGVMGALAELFGEGFEPDNNKWEDYFWRAGEALMKFGDEAEKEVYAQKLFGRSWNELIPLFEAGREEYEKTNASWSVVSKEQLTALGKMDDEYQTLSNEFETLKMTVMGSLAEGLTPLMETLNGLMKEFNTYLASPDGKAMLDSLASAVESLFTDLTKVDPEKTLQDIVGLFDRIKEGLQWISDNREGIVNGVKGFILAWAGLKTAEGVTTALQLINGVKSLGASRSAAAAGSSVASGGGGVLGFLATKALPIATGVGLVVADSLNNHGDENSWTAEEIEEIRRKNEQGSSAHVIDLRWPWASAKEKQDEYVRMAEENEARLNGATDLQAAQTSLGNPAGLRALDDAIYKMGQTAEELTGGSERTAQSTSEMTNAAANLMGLPELVAAAVSHSLNGTQVVINGGELQSVVGSVFASMLARYTVP